MKTKIRSHFPKNKGIPKIKASCGKVKGCDVQTYVLPCGSTEEYFHKYVKEITQN